MLYKGSQWEIEVNQCPMALVTRRSRRLVELYWQFVEGHYVTTRRGAGLYDQAHVYLQAMRMIGSYLEEAKRKKGRGKKEKRPQCSSQTHSSE